MSADDILTFYIAQKEHTRFKRWVDPDNKEGIYDLYCTEEVSWSIFLLGGPIQMETLEYKIN